MQEASGRASGDDQTTPSERLLKAIELIAENGILSYAELRDQLSISKTATWRLVRTLRNAGWVRLRYGGGFIELSSRLDHLFSAADFSDAEFHEVADELMEVAEASPVQCDLFVLDQAGHLGLLDSTRRVGRASAMRPVTHAHLLTAARAHMSSVQLTRHMTALASARGDTCDPEALVRHARRQLESYPGHIWGPNRQSLAVSLLGAMRTPAVVNISLKSATVPVQSFSDAYAEISRRLTGRVLAVGAAKGAPDASLPSCLAQG